MASTFLMFFQNRFFRSWIFLLVMSCAFVTLTRPVRILVSVVFSLKIQGWWWVFGVQLFNCQLFKEADVQTRRRRLLLLNSSYSHCAKMVESLNQLPKKLAVVFITEASCDFLNVKSPQIRKEPLPFLLHQTLGVWLHLLLHQMLSRGREPSDAIHDSGEMQVEVLPRTRLLYAKHKSGWSDEVTKWQSLTVPHDVTCLVSHQT